ncbi:hypothetical protein BV898_19189 [Hypsibius exemplaris]|uniref:Uncharacterized protein n=1 Tax=Hypsibius exemplaris TaxID=2072580 RepID=A0A9X6NIH8_HYPEX|nr:hypothetical protein BV898_19189 [Hypsibius exemplaris]
MVGIRSIRFIDISLQDLPNCLKNQPKFLRPSPLGCIVPIRDLPASQYRHIAACWSRILCCVVIATSLGDFSKQTELLQNV